MKRISYKDLFFGYLSMIIAQATLLSTGFTSWERVFDRAWITATFVVVLVGFSIIDMLLEGNK